MTQARPQGLAGFKPRMIANPTLGFLKCIIAEKVLDEGPWAVGAICEPPAAYRAGVGGY